MLPILIEWPIKLHTFGIMVATGFILGINYIVKEGKRQKLDPNEMLDLGFWTLVAGLLGARVLYIIVNISDYMQYPAEIFKFWKGGLVWYGGMMGAWIVGITVVIYKKMNVGQVLDIFAPASFYGLAFGRFGCLSAGDDHGMLVPKDGGWLYPLLHPHQMVIPSQAAAAGDHWWSLVFTNERSLIPDAMMNLPLYPAQIMMSVFNLCLFLFCLWFRRYQTFRGQLAMIAVMVYSIGRGVFIELYRGDVGRGFVIDGVVSTSQFISILLFMGAIWGYFFFRKRWPIPLDVQAATRGLTVEELQERRRPATV